MTFDSNKSQMSEVLISKPFKSLNELYSNINNLNPWPKVQNLQKCTEYVYYGKDISDEKKHLTIFQRNTKPKTLVCHDMKGGYLDDRFINGSDACDSYVFYHWSVLDTFVYFSHYFITVPPYGWINAAHIHGVKILGTIITEWEDGEQIWNDIFKSELEIKKFADSLISIAKFYNFDGWLLNVENKIRADDIGKLKFFIKYLTDHIHKEIENSEIIWYDSVISTGELKWQNELNDLNKCFFDACDGIFLNYNWSEPGLVKTCLKARDENRIKDIYVGLDVWGRGCPGGGGFQSEYALRKVREHDMSVAIFAPGWTHEYFGPKTFEDTENLFWAQLVPYFYIHVPLYNNEIFRTSFCRGVGSTNYHLGQCQLANCITEDSLVKETPFYNLSMQCPQISVPAPALEFVIKPDIQETIPIVESNLAVKNDTEPAVQVLNLETNVKKEVVDIFYETKRSKVKVQGDTIAFESKNPILDLNYFQFSNRSSFNGGGCLELITKNPLQYHRLFLVEVTIERGIQVSLVYHTDMNVSDQSEPILVTGNNSNLNLIKKYKTEKLNFPWRRNLYLTNFNTITQIGIAVSKEGTITLGEIVVEQKKTATAVLRTAVVKGRPYAYIYAVIEYKTQIQYFKTPGLLTFHLL